MRAFGSYGYVIFQTNAKKLRTAPRQSASANCAYIAKQEKTTDPKDTFYFDSLSQAHSVSRTPTSS